MIGSEDERVNQDVGTPRERIAAAVEGFRKIEPLQRAWAGGRAEALDEVEAAVNRLHHRGEVCNRCGLPNTGIHAKGHAYEQGGGSDLCVCGLRWKCRAAGDLLDAIVSLRDSR